LAREHQATLALLHVSAPDAEVDNDVLAVTSEELKLLASRLPDVPTTVISAWGDPASVIIGQTAECDLLVMRPSRPWWLVGRLVDSLSQRVCRLAHCPVMLIDPRNGKNEQALRTPPRSRQYGAECCFIASPSAAADRS